METHLNAEADAVVRGKVVRVVFPLCEVTWYPEMRKCITRFLDGTEAHAIPHDTDAYRKHAVEKSTGDVDLYCWQHDIAHVIVGMLHGGVSRVLGALAHGGSTEGPEFDAEEREAQELQRKLFLRA
jgi:hypothetical protein